MEKKQFFSYSINIPQNYFYTLGYISRVGILDQIDQLVDSMSEYPEATHALKQFVIKKGDYGQDS